MFIEKDQRYFRRYNLRIKPRAKFAAPLPLIGGKGDWCVINALRLAKKNGRAVAPQSNGDTIELIEIKHMPEHNVLVLLFHRSSPNAADPAYRKKANDKITLRQTKKAADEEQAVSCHLVVSTKEKGGYYQSALEEIPSLSATAALSIVGRILQDYRYPYTKNKKSLETNSVFRIEGVKAESLTDALKKKGHLEYLTLVRTSPCDAPDASGIAEPQTERIKYKIIGDPRSSKWKTRFREFVEGTKADWDQVQIGLLLEDDRHRTINVDRETEASEILFVRSHLELIGEDLNPCSLDIVESVVKAGIRVLKKR